MQIYETAEQLTLFDLDFLFGKMSPELFPSENQRARTSASFSRKSSESKTIPFMSLDLDSDALNLLGEYYWEILSPWRGGSSTLNTGALPNDVKESSLSQILQAQVPRRYYLSKTACLGILRRARERGKELPPQLKRALEIQAGVAEPDGQPTELEAYHINQRDEGIPLGGVSGALMATSNMQMQTFVTDSAVAFAANQRDEVRDLHDVAGALGAQPGMKQQTFIAEGCLTPWDTQQERIFSPEGKAPTLAGADGGGGRNPAGLLFAAGFCAGAGPSAGGVGYHEEVSPTLKAASSGTNMVPSILCLNDQGGKRMDLSHDISGTLRADEKGHQPLVMATQQGGAEIGEGVCPTITAAAGLSGNNQPVLYENHGIDSRYTGPHEVAPTMSARYGTGGNNVPLVSDDVDAICIAGNIIDRQPENGGNGLGCQPDIAYTLTATDHHAVFSRQRVDVFKDDEVASTQSARQHKDATDLICYGQAQHANYKEGVSTLRASGGDNGGGSENLISSHNLIRRLTPLECERLQGFPDGWTDIPGASDSARYKALGNSVAIPCVEFVLRGIAYFLEKSC